jgi:hypothetical protein
MGRSRFGWTQALGIVGVVSAPGAARADPVPGFDLDPVKLTARMAISQRSTRNRGWPTGRVVPRRYGPPGVRERDHPDDRATIGAEIEVRLDAFRASAPWPIPAGD